MWHRNYLSKEQVIRKSRIMKINKGSMCPSIKILYFKINFPNKTHLVNKTKTVEF